jgi:hypothetical protein
MKRKLVVSIGLFVVLAIAVVVMAQTPQSNEGVAAESAVQQVRAVLAADPNLPRLSAKMDARMRLVFAARIVDLTKVGGAEIVEADKVEVQSAKPRQIPPAQEETGPAAAMPFQGLLNFDMVEGQPAISIVVESPVPALLPAIAQRHGARYEGALAPVKSATFVLPVSCLPDLLADPDVSKVRAPIKARVKQTLALADTHTDVVHNTLNLHGSGAIYASVDSGIDVTQMDFKTDATHTRIQYLWDQTVTETPPTGYSYGTEWTAAQINAGSCTETSSSTSDWGHGTSTAGVGAGNGSSGDGGYIGQADQADIIFVKSDLTDAHIEDALSYIKDKAASMGKPVSINMSFGGSYGPHDGSDDLSYWIDNTLGISDSTTGFVLSAAAGNETGGQNHVGGAICPENPSCAPNCTNSMYDTNTRAYSSDNTNSMAPMVEEWYLPASYTIQVKVWIPIWYKTSGQCNGAVSGFTLAYSTTGWVTISAANSGFYSITRKITGTGSSSAPCFDSFLGDGGTSTPGKIGVYLDLQNPMADYHNSNIQYVYVEYDPATTTQSPNHGGDLYELSGGNQVPLIIQFRQDGGTGSGARVDGYIAYDGHYDYFAAGGPVDCATGTTTGSYLNGNDEKMINGPSAAHTVLSVGGHVTRNSWTDKSSTARTTTQTLNAIASYSTHGPLRGISEGNSVVTDQKPNLTAPSETITTLSDDFLAAWYDTAPQNQNMPLENPINKHIFEEGTSFSSPQVAGGAAILLGAHPTLTLQQVRNYLQNGARSDANTGTVPNDTWGYGKFTLDNSLHLVPPEHVPYSVTPTRMTTANKGVDTTVTWDVTNCPSTNYHIIYGYGSNLVNAMTTGSGIAGGQCGINAPTPGNYSWNGTPDPSGDSTGYLWYLIVGDDGAATEGSWGLTSAGAERGGTSASNVCSMATKNTTGTCSTP